MIRLVIDSTHFRKDVNLIKEDISRLREYGRMGLVQLNIPYIVLNEVKTATTEELSKSIKRASSEIQSLPRKGLYQNELQNLKTIENSLDKLLSRVQTSVDQLWQDFINDSNAVVLKLQPNHTINVFECYFNALPPFASLKNRKDIPDAFIYFEIVRLSNIDEVYVLTGDGDFSIHLKKLERVHVFSEFKELFRDNKFKFLEQKINDERGGKLIGGKLINLLPFFEEKAIEYFDSLNSVEIYGHGVPSDNGYAEITLFENIEVAADRDHIDMIDWKFFIPAKVTADVELEYFMYTADYLSAGLTNSHAEQINKYGFLIGQSVAIEFDITIIVENVSLTKNSSVLIDEHNYEDIQFMTKLVDENYDPRV